LPPWRGGRRHSCGGEPRCSGCQRRQDRRAGRPVRFDRPVQSHWQGNGITGFARSALHPGIFVIARIEDLGFVDAALTDRINDNSRQRNAQCVGCVQSQGVLQARNAAKVLEVRTPT
jgi:hypothetical protein